MTEHIHFVRGERGGVGGLGGGVKKTADTEGNTVRRHLPFTMSVWIESSSDCINKNKHCFEFLKTLVERSTMAGILENMAT